jgi:hypothetical protein
MAEEATLGDKADVTVDCRGTTFSYTIVQDNLIYGKSAALELRNCDIESFEFGENIQEPVPACLRLTNSIVRLTDSCTVRCRVHDADEHRCLAGLRADRTTAAFTP